MIVTHNLQSMFAQRNLGSVSTRKKKSTEKLSSGYKINRAADDAAGLTISEKMRSLVRGLSQGVENTQDGISMCQIADGALEEVHDMLHRITELSVKASNGTNTAEDRQAIQSEINSLLAEIDRVSESTEFNTMPIFKLGPDIELSSGDEIDISDDEIINQLVNGTFPDIAGDILVDGEVMLTADEANGLLRILNNVQLGIEQRWRDPYTFTEENKDKIKNFYFTTLDNLEYFAQYASEATKTPQATIEKLEELRGLAEDAFMEEIGSDECKQKFQYIRDQFDEYAKWYPPLKFDMGHGSTTGFGMIMDDYYSMNTTLGYASTPSFPNIHEPEEYLEYLGINSGDLRDLSNSLHSTSHIRDGSEYTTKMYRFLYNNEVETNPGVWIQSGAHDGDGMYIQFGRIDTGRLGIKGLDASTESGARDAIESSKKAVNKVSKLRSHIGAQQNRLEHTVANENNIVENTQAAESRIRDTDMPAEMVRNAKENILEQVGYSVLAQANQSTQGVLTLLNR